MGNMRLAERSTEVSLGLMGDPENQQLVSELARYDYILRSAAMLHVRHLSTTLQ